MKKLPILIVGVLAFLAFSVSFVVAAPSDYKTCVSCTQNGYKWMVSSVFCSSGCRADCPWTCWYNGCMLTPSECTGYCDSPEECASGQTCVENEHSCKSCESVVTESDCENGGDCCWIEGINIYGTNTKKCVAKSIGCDKIICGNFYCEADEKCCAYKLGGGQSGFASCYIFGEQECLSNGICNMETPAITTDVSTVTVDTQNIPKSKYHIITVENKDNPLGVCPASTFNLSLRYTCPENWKCTFDLSEFTLNPEGKGIVSLKIEPPSTLSSGTYTITVYATNKRTGSYANVEIKYIVGKSCGSSVCILPQCCKENSCVAEGTCWDENICSAGEWATHCGDGKKNCEEVCNSDSDCNSPPDSCYKSSGTCASDCGSCSYGSPTCDGTTCSVGSSDYCSDCTHCGDGKCNCGETFSTCINDCGDRCNSNSDCNDNNVCTNDWCESPTASNSVCHNDAVSGTDCGDCKECKSGVCTYLCKGTPSNCGCVNDKCEDCCLEHSYVDRKCENEICSTCVAADTLAGKCISCGSTTSCFTYEGCQGTEASCECVDGSCKDCSNYYGTDCGSEDCDSDEKPSWYCTGGSCAYTCVHDDSCGSAPTETEITLYKGQTMVGLPGADFSNCETGKIKSTSGTCTYENYFVSLDASGTRDTECSGDYYSSDTMEGGAGYYVYVKSDTCTVSYEVPTEVEITLYKGLNMISTPIQTTSGQIINICGEGSLGKIKSTSGTCTYENYFVSLDASGTRDTECSGDYYSSDTMEVGYGYFVNFKGKNGDGATSCVLKFSESDGETVLEAL